MILHSIQCKQALKRLLLKPGCVISLNHEYALRKARFELFSLFLSTSSIHVHPAFLFAVVYHHGNSATGGHYTTDVFQIGLNGWLRIDDQAVKVINQYQVVKPSAERSAYLLYYRRVDLL